MGILRHKKLCVLALHDVLLHLRRYTHKVEALFNLYCEPVVISINYYHTRQKSPDGRWYTRSLNVGCQCIIRTRTMKKAIWIYTGSLFKISLIFQKNRPILFGITFVLQSRQWLKSTIFVRSANFRHS